MEKLERFSWGFVRGFKAFRKVSEGNITPDNGNRVADEAKLVVICSTTGRFSAQEIMSTSHEGFAISKINGVYYCSCYALPRFPIDQFSSMLDPLLSALVCLSPMVIDEDFIAWAIE